MSNTIQIEFTQGSQDTLRRFTVMPSQIVGAMTRGMDKGAMLTIGDIQARRLTGLGPFPEAEGRLGVKSGRLRQSLRATPTVPDGSGLSLTIGTNVKYAGLHEFGAEFTKTSKPGKVRLAVDKHGRLIKRGNLATFATVRNLSAHTVAFKGGRTFTVRIPARAPIGHGVADNAATFTREVDNAIKSAIK